VRLCEPPDDELDDYKPRRGDRKESPELGGTFANIQLHLVFSTKHREPLIVPDMRQRLYSYMGGVIRNEGCSLYEIGGTADHLHLLVRVLPKKSVSDFMRDLKSSSSGWVHDSFVEMKRFHWQDGFGAFSVSQSQASRVKEYIRNQEDHHRQRGFEPEFIGLLKRHEIEYDERYIWD
jgi:putative transposase